LKATTEVEKETERNEERDDFCFPGGIPGERTWKNKYIKYNK
jgi:hypothetical protein